MRGPKPRQPFLRRGNSLATRLFGAWLMTEGCGSTTRDVSGFSSHAALVNLDPAIAWRRSRLGAVLEFDNTVNHYLDLPDRPARMLENCSAITISAWAQRTAAGQRDEIIDLGISGDHFSKVSFGFLASDELRIGGRSIPSESYQAKSTASTWTDGQWHHYVGILDLAHDDARLYVDGVQQPASGSPSWTNDSFSSDTGNRHWVGQSIGGTPHPFSGPLAVLAVWGRILSPREIIRLYIDPYAMATAVLRRVWFTSVSQFVSGPYRTVQTDIFLAAHLAGYVFSTGPSAGDTFTAGQVKGQTCG